MTWNKKVNIKNDWLKIGIALTLTLETLFVAKLGGAMGKTGEKQIGNRNVRETKEGKDPPSFLSSSLIKIRVSNWSKLI